MLTLILEAFGFQGKITEKSPLMMISRIIKQWNINLQLMWFIIDCHNGLTTIKGVDTS